jgi:O-antigen/teichoic acid export membrane protein
MNGKSFYILGQLQFIGFNFLFSLAAAHALGPRLMGQWQTALLISSYAPALCIGVVNGLGRELPFSLGEGRHNDVQTAIATTSRVVLSIALLLVLLIPLTAQLPGVDSLVIAAIIMGLSAARLINGFSTILLRSLQKFTRLGLHQALTALALAGTILFLQWNSSLLVVAAGMTLSLLISSVLAARFVTLSEASRVTAARLIRSGLPIYAAGLLFTLLGSIDRWLVLSFLGTASLGLYTPAILAFAIITVSPMLVSNIKYPHLGYLYGKSKSISTLLPEIRRIILLNLGISSIVSVTGFLVMYYFLIPEFLPEYERGLHAMTIIFACGLVLPLGQSFGDLFNVIGRQRNYLQNMAAGFLINTAVGGFLLGIAGWGLEGVAVGTFAGIVTFSVLQILSYRTVLRESSAA